MGAMNCRWTISSTFLANGSLLDAGDEPQPLQSLDEYCGATLGILKFAVQAHHAVLLERRRVPALRILEHDGFHHAVFVLQRDEENAFAGLGGWSLDANDDSTYPYVGPMWPCAQLSAVQSGRPHPVSYTHLRAHETR